MNEEECGCVRCGYCCTEMEIKVLDLVFPDLFLPPKGLEFYRAHGLDEIVKNNQMVKIIHRCQHLIGKNECGIEDHKPDFCREWECRRHLRGSQWFKERVGELAVEAIGEMKKAMDNKIGIVGVDGLIDKSIQINKIIADFERLAEQLLERGMKE